MLRSLTPFVLQLLTILACAPEQKTLNKTIDAKNGYKDLLLGTPSRLLHVPLLTEEIDSCAQIRKTTVDDDSYYRIGTVDFAAVQATFVADSLSAILLAGRSLTMTDFDQLQEILETKFGPPTTREKRLLGDSDLTTLEWEGEEVSLHMEHHAGFGIMLRYTSKDLCYREFLYEENCKRRRLRRSQADL